MHRLCFFTFPAAPVCMLGFEITLVVVSTCPTTLTVRTWSGRCGRKMSQRPRRHASEMAAVIWAALVPTSRARNAEGRENVNTVTPGVSPAPGAAPLVGEEEPLEPPQPLQPPPLQPEAVQPPLTFEPIEVLLGRADANLRALAERRQLVVYGLAMGLD